jgi:hypothetical protein
MEETRKRRRRPPSSAPPSLPSYFPEQDLDFPYLRRFGPPPGELFARLAAGGVSGSVVEKGEVFLVPSEDAWNEADCLADYYTEFARVRSRVLGRRTVLEVWAAVRTEQRSSPSPAAPPRSWGVLSRERLRLWFLREAVYARAAAGQCTNFRPSFVGCFLDWCRGRWSGRFDRPRVLDPCAGWGDRLLGSLAAGVASYTAVDPNPKVHEGYRHMLLGGELFPSIESRERRGAFIVSSPSGLVEVDLHEAPFEDFDARGRRFDVVLTSPPFGPREIYWAPGSRSQAEQMTGGPKGEAGKPSDAEKQRAVIGRETSLERSKRLEKREDADLSAPERRDEDALAKQSGV